MTIKLFSSNSTVFIRVSLILTTLLNTSGIFSQHTFVYDNSIPVIRGADTLKNPWAGGLNFIQLSHFDFDQDGVEDLLAFDRSSNQINVFVQTTDANGPYYKYQFGAEQYFPSDLRYRVQLVDYNNDGKQDLFTWTAGGLRVYRNDSNPIDGLQWVLYQDVVYSDYATTGINPLFISSDDLPAIVDVDYDGDIDILTSDNQGLRIVYHQNQSMDLYGIPDSLIFVQKNECWGKFTEGISSSVITLFDPNPPCVGGNISNPEIDSTTIVVKSGAHQGTTILAIDIDSSGVRDLILGDAAYNGLTLLINDGTAVNTDSPMISFDDAFPSYTTPVKCNNFPGAFYLDVDFDGLKDLIASPNSENSSFDKNSVLFYKNIATNGAPIFTPTSTNFLQSNMIEHGTGSIPVLFDYNEDGLSDLLVANYYNYKATNQKESLIALYQNIGTPTDPVFQFVDDDVLNLAFSNFGLRTVPAFGDIDGDGDEDMVLGLEDGTVRYYENNSTGSGAVWGTGIANYQDNLSNPISVNGFCFPQLFDIDDDGLLDLLLGDRVGNITFYKNIGTTTSPSFQLVNSMLGQVDIMPGNLSSNAAIHFFRDSNEIQLLCGSFDGKISYYTNISSNLSNGDAFNLVSDNYQGIDLGKHSSIYVNDLDGDGILNAIIGQDSGGLFHYDLIENNLGLSEINLPKATLFPNPAENFISIESKQLIAKITTMDIQGSIQSIDSIENSKKAVLSTKNLSSGVYVLFIEFTTGQIISKKLIVK